MRTPKQIFDEELSGEPLTEEAIIEALKICWNEAIETSANNAETHINKYMWNQITVDKNSILKLKIK